MTATHKTATGLWEITHGHLPITVRGKSRSGCEERMCELAERYQETKEVLTPAGSGQRPVQAVSSWPALLRCEELSEHFPLPLVV